MKNFKLILQIVLILAVIGVWASCKYLRSEEHKIKKQLIAICEDVSKSSRQEGNTTAAFKVVALGNRLADHVEVSVHGIPISGGFSGEELMSHVTRARMYVDDLLVHVRDQIVTIDGDNASIDCVIHANAHAQDYSLDEDYHLILSLERNKDGKWLFNAFHENEILQK